MKHNEPQSTESRARHCSDMSAAALFPLDQVAAHFPVRQRPAERAPGAEDPQPRRRTAADPIRAARLVLAPPTFEHRGLRLTPVRADRGGLQNSLANA